MSSELKTKVGGQAVMEGVMMRSPKCFAVVVRRKDGALIVREQPWVSKWSSSLAKLPFVRGAATLVESMSNGYQALSFSAEQMEEDMLAEEAQKTESPEQAAKREQVPAAAEGAYSEASAPKAETGSAQNATKFAGLFAALFFIALPQMLAWLVGKFVGPGIGLQDFSFHLLTGAFKLALVLGYMMAIRRIPEIKRVFQYHGAEHKAIATFEAGEPLEVRYAKLHSTRHARCGTTFLIVVVMVSVLVYALLLPPILRALGLDGSAAQFVSFLIKLALVPPIAGLSYELQRIGARFADHPIARVFLTPGYMVQGITTIEPSDDQLEVALASLRVTLAREAAEAAGKSTPITEPVVRRYSSFNAFAENFAIAGLKGQ